MAGRERREPSDSGNSKCEPGHFVTKQSVLGADLGRAALVSFFTQPALKEAGSSGRFTFPAVNHQVL
jgi:hypothetical protein